MKSLITLIAILFFYQLSAQVTIERQLIGTTGGSFVSGTIDMNFSVGEAVVTTETSGSIILTQGFQQADENAVGLNELTEGFGINLYPNPFTSTVIVEFTDDSSKNGELSFKVYDNQGKLVYQQDEELNNGYGNKIQLDLTHLVTGHYIVFITDASGKTSRRTISKI